jgi:hypothetical protein
MNPEKRVSDAEWKCRQKETRLGIQELDLRFGACCNHDVMSVSVEEAEWRQKAVENF